MSDDTASSVEFTSGSDADVDTGDNSPFFQMAASSSSLATTPEDSPMLRPTQASLLFATQILAEETRALQAAMLRLSNDKDTVEGFTASLHRALCCIENEGKLVWCGVGKSGIIARKLCATALSLGISSVYLHPVEALHGDLGLVHNKDVVMLLSYSGGSSEVTALLPHIISRGAALIALCGNRQSDLVKQSQGWVDCRLSTEAASKADKASAASRNMSEEAWSEVPAPSSTTTLTLAMGDALVLALAKELGKGKRDFALNHPNGSLGKAMREEGLQTCGAPPTALRSISDATCAI